MSDNLEKVYSIIAASNNGTTVKSISKTTGLSDRTVYDCLKELMIQRRVRKDPETSSYRNTLLPLRGYLPRRCHGLMIHFTKHVGQTVLEDFIGYIQERHPDLLIQRKLSVKPNTHSTLDFTTTNNPLTLKELEILEEITRLYLDNTNWIYSRFTYNIDNALCTLEPRAVTIKESHGLLRLYNHPYNCMPHLRLEVEKTKISHEEALKMLLYQADIDYLLDIIFRQDRLIEALKMQLNRERIRYSKMK
jgi:hypothetical protein